MSVHRKFTSNGHHYWQIMLKEMEMPRNMDKGNNQSFSQLSSNVIIINLFRIMAETINGKALEFQRNKTSQGGLLNFLLIGLLLTKRIGPNISHKTITYTTRKENYNANSF
jgi:hypothetical protein